MAADTPYKDLYIYYLEGRINPDHGIFGAEFIGNWEEDNFSFLFLKTPSREKIDEILLTHPGLTLIDNYQMTYDEWQGEMPFPLNIGRFAITTPWALSDNIDKGIKIILDPGVVFGTGTHPTTHDCIEALEMAFSNEDIESAVDLGTGTGVLAIAAAYLGAKKILAADINYLAVNTAKRNFFLNGMQDRILSVQGLAQDYIELPADLLIANIHHDIMKIIVRSEGFLNKKYFVLSGLLKSEAKEIDLQLSKLPVIIVQKWDCNGIWHTFFGKVF
ncbi:MAG: 50S ribosomal protein L11 methyltransferase [Pseudomonadota bacterium]|nr:50S ribosomal protein L11 methyltransferase [Pseudomonadota bacterium]MBU1397853.1 50S ribosomal protein L11 methyltransferase [Pseudomonadota bacterium]